MPLIQRRCIEEIRRRVNLYDVVSPYVNLRKAGSQWRGLSPFTEEKSPSFFIHPEKNVFKCYSSGHAGDIFRFVQIKENLSFNEAIESLARQFNIPLEYESGGASTETLSLRKELFEIHEITKGYYQHHFNKEDENGAWIRQYWQNERKFSLEIAKEFEIGLAPPDPRPLLEHLIKKKFSLDALKNCGLFYAKEHEKNPHNLRPRFRGRLMIPIQDVQGRTIAFTARVLPLTPKNDPTLEAKYVNSPETPIFSKSHILFGLERARKEITEQTAFILVEGQLDVIRCHEKGLKTAVAPQGTSITESQLALIRRYTTHAQCVMDGDSAGKKAAFRLLPMALKMGLEVEFLQLEAGNDPDSFLEQHGPEGYKTLAQRAQGSMEFAVKILAPKGMASSASEKTHAFEQIFGFFNGIDSLSFAEANLKKVGNLLGLYEYTIDRELAKIKLSPQKTNSIDNQKDNKSPSAKLTTAEYQLLLMIFHNDSLARPIADAIDPQWVDTHTLHGRLLNRFLGEIKEELWKGTESIDSCLENDKERNCVYGLLTEEAPFEDDIHAANACIQSLFTHFYKNKQQALTQAIAGASQADSQKIQDLQKQRIQIRNILKNPPEFSLKRTI